MLKNKLTYILYRISRKLYKSWWELLVLNIWDIYKNVKNFIAKSENKSLSKTFIKYRNIENKLLRKRINFVDFKNLLSWIDDWMEYLPRDFDVVVGIPRSGLLVANVIALKMAKPLSTPDQIVNDKYWFSRTVKEKVSIKKVLLVDDSLSGGKTMEQFAKKLKKWNPKLKIIKAALIVTKEGKSKVDFYYKVVPQPRIFEWNLLYAVRGKLAVDLDGVICEECPPGVDGDEKLYKHWILNSKPYLIPSFEIDVIISNRLEKYRISTEDWLNRNKVKFKKLYMWDIATKGERGNKFAKHKIDVLLREKPDVFWESSLAQSMAIFKNTGIPTLCISEKILLS